MKIYIWGTGNRTRYYLKLNYFSNCDIRGFICTDKTENEYKSLPVYSLEELMEKQKEVDYIVIANEFYEQILFSCVKQGINENKIVITDNIPIEPYKTYYERIKFVSIELYNVLEKAPYILVKSNEYDLKDPKILMKKGKYARSIYMQDYFRFRTFELVANQINDINIPGAVAELGVFQGHFSSLINAHFKDRKMYLFDTFEGFSEDESTKELELGRCDERFIKEHEDTSVSRMMKNLPYPDKAIVCKGFFPKSIPYEACDEDYVFVSLDVDFEESMYQGLKFFYPRMVLGGMIFMHDYNTYYLDGIKKAIERYERDQHIRLNRVPIADRAGSLIIIKS